jgi:hypothetical protein
MGYGRPLASASRYETLGATTGLGTTVTSGSTANTFGATITLGTTSFDYDGIFITTESTGNNISLVDIIVNNGGSDQIIVTTVPVPHNAGGALMQSTSGLIPVRIPAGAVVKAKMQSVSLSATANVMVTGVQGSNGMSLGFRGLACCTDITSGQTTNGITMTSTTQTSFAFGQIQASTPNRIAGLYWSYDPRGTTAGASQVLLQVGWGPSGGEQVLFTAGFTFSSVPVLQGPYPCDLPAGTRLAARMQASGTVTQTVSILLHGLIA